MKALAFLTSSFLIFTLNSITSAETTEYSAAYGPVAAAYGPATVASLQKFNPADGILQQVTLTLESDTLAGSIAWDNESDVVTDVTLGIGATVTIQALTALAATAVPVRTDTGYGVAADEEGEADFVGNDAFSVSGGTGSDSDSDTSTDSSVLALFTGTGTFDVTLTSDTYSFYSATGGYGPTQQTPGVTDGTVRVTYEYAIPEPATLGLLAVGGVGLLARNRRSK